MQYNIIKNPMGMLEVSINKGEEITAEAGALVYMKGDIEIKTRMRNKGFLKSVKVAMLGGETFFVNDFVANEDNCILGLTGPPIGDIFKITLDEEYIIQSGAYIASTSGVDLDTKWQGFTKGLFGTELFMLKASGKGDVFVNSYGSIIEKTLEHREKMLLDNYHLVALTANSEYDVVKVGGLKTTILGGEGLATDITGPAKVYFQTKNLKELIDLLGIKHRAETRGPSFKFP
jgi:uncharacterized protein (TIGR00266 family)